MLLCKAGSVATALWYASWHVFTQSEHMAFVATPADRCTQAALRTTGF